MFDVQILLSYQEILILKQLLRDEIEALQYKMSHCKDRKSGCFHCEADRKEILELEKQSKQRLIMVQLAISKLEQTPNKMPHAAF